MQKHDTNKVFTPTSPAQLTFVNREGFNTRLVTALNTPGKQIVIYGHTGSGKTTVILNKLKQTYTYEITTRCMEGMTFEQLVLDAFDQLSPYYVEAISSDTTSEISTGIKSIYAGIQAQVTAKQTTKVGKNEQRILPPQLTAQNLSNFIGEIKACWVLEDFHKLEKGERSKLSQVMKVFMDQAVNYPELKIIAIGAVDTARYVVQYDHEMKNRVSEIEVPLMIEDEVKQILTKGEECLNIEFDDNVRLSIVKFSNGIAAVCHALAMNCCMAKGIYQTVENKVVIDSDDLNKALEAYVEESSDSLKSVFDKAFKVAKTTKYDNYRLIIAALTKYPQEGVVKGAILQDMQKDYPDYPSTNLSHCLGKLQSSERGAVVRFDSSSNLYSFAEPIYRVFALAYLENTKGESLEQMTFDDAITNDVIKDLTKELKSHLDDLLTKLSP